MTSDVQRWIKQTKLDDEFILALNDYLDRFKAKIYKDLIRRRRRDVSFDQGRSHTQTLTALIRCLWHISLEQAKGIVQDSTVAQRTVVYTMTAIDYILQRHFPPKKALFFSYILNELIAMWLHENLRSLQEDLPIIVEHHRAALFVPLCEKFTSICTINWERLQMVQNYRLAHFDQLMTSTLETRKDFLQQFGSSLDRSDSSSMTLLYSHRTEKELTRLREIEQRFRTAIALDPNEKETPSKQSDHIERDRVSIEVRHDPSRCTPSAVHPSNNACLITTDSLLTFSITVE